MSDLTELTICAKYWGPLDDPTAVAMADIERIIKATRTNGRDERSWWMAVASGSFNQRPNSTHVETVLTIGQHSGIVVYWCFRCRKPEDDQVITTDRAICELFRLGKFDSGVFKRVVYPQIRDIIVQELNKVREQLPHTFPGALDCDPLDPPVEDRTRIVELQSDSGNAHATS